MRLHDHLGVICEDEFAELTELSTSTLRRWRHEKRAPMPVRLGNAWFYFLDDIQTELMRLRSQASPVDTRSSAAQGETT
ncbi:hypothetical protein SuNHUV7_00590 (plasmid) [Pseudoseohaeicola sp. NH-UV-7]|uniref:helix-turn-helix transcriptional regulator n=1 Tax=Sulfitobacter sp. TBRI5 TaxID=2989732 RepID=UPI003A78C250